MTSKVRRKISIATLLVFSIAETEILLLGTAGLCPLPQFALPAPLRRLAVSLRDPHPALPFARRRSRDAEQVAHRRTDARGPHQPGNPAPTESDATPAQEPIRKGVAGAMP